MLFILTFFLKKSLVVLTNKCQYLEDAKGRDELQLNADLGM